MTVWAFRRPIGSLAGHVFGSGGARLGLSQTGDLPGSGEAWFCCSRSPRAQTYCVSFGVLSLGLRRVLALIAISLGLLCLHEGVVFRCAGPWWQVLRRAAQPRRRESPTMPPDTLVHEPRKVLVISSAIRRAMPGTISKMVAGMENLATAKRPGERLSDCRIRWRAVPPKPPKSAASSGQQGQPHRPAIRWTVPVRRRTAWRMRDQPKTEMQNRC